MSRILIDGKPVNKSAISRNRNTREMRDNIAREIAQAWVKRVSSVDGSGDPVTIDTVTKSKRQMIKASQERLSSKSQKTHSRQIRNATAWSLVKLYRDAFLERYKEIRELASEVISQRENMGLEWKQRKRNLKSTGGVAHYQANPQAVKYVSPGLATGYLRDTIAGAMTRSGGGGIISFASLSVTAGFEFDPEALFAIIGDGREQEVAGVGRSGYARFIYDVVTADSRHAGLTSEAEIFAAFVDLPPRYWASITDKMLLLIEQGFYPEVERSLKDLKVI